ncbi:MAG: YHS domain-containing protein [Verrucomicrobiae bacterium]|nr:YHS domain-containing protein [Verrucomicrobiae bacterium]
MAGLSLFGTSCDSGGGDDHSDHEHAEGGEHAAADAKDDAYPLDVCIVSGEALDSMGEPVTIDYEGTTVKFCCKDCIEDFKKDPDKYLPKLTQASQK